MDRSASISLGLSVFAVIVSVTQAYFSWIALDSARNSAVYAGIVSACSGICGGYGDYRLAVFDYSDAVKIGKGKHECGDCRKVTENLYRTYNSMINNIVALRQLVNGQNLEEINELSRNIRDSMSDYENINFDENKHVEKFDMYFNRMEQVCRKAVGATYNR